MNQTGVCPLLKGPQWHCVVYVAFVFGDHKQPNRANHNALAELFLNKSENMNTGKSLEFFSYAARAFPWATHIGKMDLDTFPYLHDLTTSLHHKLRGGCQAHYVGLPMDKIRCGPSKDYCPPRKCGLPVGEDFFRYARGNCWSYMQGGLYIMSRNLAENVTRDQYWNSSHTGDEDLLAGKAVTNYGKKYGACVRTWNPDAWDHLQTENLEREDLDRLRQVAGREDSGTAFAPKAAGRAGPPSHRRPRDTRALKAPGRANNLVNERPF